MSTELFADALEITKSSKSYEDILHTFHTKYESRIYDFLRSKYLDFFRSWWKTYELPLVSSNKCIVIYETRCHNNLEFLIYNFTYFAKGWGLIIYCSKENYNFINNILGHNRYRAMLQIVRDDEGGREVRNEYNEFTKSWQFWNSLPCEYILMCEMDTYLRRSIPDDIINYDYVCCQWPWYNELAGGGGMSIRRVSAMKKICMEYSNLINEIFAQDSWVAEGCKLLKLVYNNTYLVEANHVIENPIGFHNWWTFINPNKLSEYSRIYDKYLTLELS